jgi:hypothetical protein
MLGGNISKCIDKEILYITCQFDIRVYKYIFIFRLHICKPSIFIWVCFHRQKKSLEKLFISDFLAKNITLMTES